MAKINKEGLRNIIYGRKSKFTGKGESVENQVDLCKNDIILHNPNITDDDILIFMDEGFTGANLNRPAFQEMMNYINQFTIMNFHYLLRAKIGVNKAIALQKLRKNSAYSAPLR